MKVIAQRKFTKQIYINQTNVLCSEHANPKNNDKDECGQDVASFIFLMEGGDQLFFCQ
jgi:hypothetical protein